MSSSSYEIPTLFARKLQLCAPTAFCMHPPSQCNSPPPTGPSCPSLALLLSPSQIHVQTAANVFHSSFIHVANLHRKHPHEFCFLHFIINPSLNWHLNTVPQLLFSGSKHSHSVWFCFHFLLCPSNFSAPTPTHYVHAPF